MSRISIVVLFLVWALAAPSFVQGWGRLPLESRSLLLGPIEVPPNTMKMDMVDFPKPVEEEFAWVSLNMRLVDEAGNDVTPDSIYLHHVVIGSYDKRSVMCRYVRTKTCLIKIVRYTDRSDAGIPLANVSGLAVLVEWAVISLERNSPSRLLTTRPRRNTGM
jgi:hypothetical protein